jgi:predicted nucleic acid-binding protein
VKPDLPQQDLTVLINLLFESIRVTPRDKFEDRLPDARTQIAEVDPDDVPFLGLALHLDAGVWSDDAPFHEQDAVDVWPTHELVDQLDLG